jgi:hypothetical protein
MQSALFIVAAPRLRVSASQRRLPRLAPRRFCVTLSNGHLPRSVFQIVIVE